MSESSRTVNIITTAMVVIGILIIGVIAFIILRQRAAPPEAALALPTVAVLPTETATNTPRPTLPATFTLTPTITLTPTQTLTPTFTPSVSPTITDTPTHTPTPSQSDTPTPSDTPTATNTSNVPSPTPTPTRSPFPFEVRGGNVIFTQNTFNTAGCAYQAVAGQVLSLTGTALDGIAVHVIGEGGIDLGATSGNATAFGGGGYEVVVDSKINGKTYFVELRSLAGTVVSERIMLTFPSNCDQNVALIYWIQNRPF